MAKLNPSFYNNEPTNSELKAELDELKTKTDNIKTEVDNVKLELEKVKEPKPPIS